MKAKITIGKIKKLSIPTEAQEQRWLVKWIKSHPKLHKFVIGSRNEGKRTPAQTNNLKLMGMRVGTSDLFLAHPNNTKTKSGLWLEVKRNMKYPPSAMKTDTWMAEEEFLKDMISVGFAGEFCYGFEHGIKIIESYLLT